MNNSCVKLLSNALRTHNLTITIDGKLFKTLSYVEYKINILKLCALIMIGFLIHIIKLFPYRPITIIGNTIYSRVVVSTLDNFNIPFILCKENNKITHYETSDNREISFEGPTPNFYSKNYTNSSTCLIPLTTNQLNKLQFHTKFGDLDLTQKNILAKFPNINGVSTIDINGLKYEGKMANPVIQIKKFFNNSDLYYVMTTNEIWITKIIITDIIAPLQPGEILSTLYRNKIENPHNNYNIEISEKICTITEPDYISNIKRHECYSVSRDLSINPLTLEMSDDYEESILYNLSNPRPFNGNGIYNIHPFHLPVYWDPFLTIMIITKAIMEKNNIMEL